MVVMLQALAGQDMQIFFYMLDSCMMDVFILLSLNCPSLPLNTGVV